VESYRPSRTQDPCTIIIRGNYFREKESGGKEEYVEGNDPRGVLNYNQVTYLKFNAKIQVLEPLHRSLRCGVVLWKDRR
jgi:hypothetical protein